MGSQVPQTLDLFKVAKNKARTMRAKTQAKQ